MTDQKSTEEFSDQELIDDFNGKIDRVKKLARFAVKNELAVKREAMPSILTELRDELCQRGLQGEEQVKEAVEFFEDLE
jgi:hypothetical protein